MLATATIGVTAAHADPGPLPFQDPDDSAQILKTIADQHAFGEAQKQFLASPGQQAEREDSLTAHRSETATEAIRTLQDEFAPELSALSWFGTQMAQGDDYDKFLSDTVARVTIGGRHQIVDSTVPLRTPDEEGHLAPVDLTVVPDGSGYSTENALIDVHLPHTLSTGITIGTGATALKLVPADADGAATGKPVDDIGTLYANTSTDADVIAAPLPTGVETFVQLRSPAAPEISRLKVDATGTVTLTKTPAGEIAVRVDGVQAGRVPAPWAKDAQGRDVPVEMDVDDDTIVLTVRHRDANVAYPILVDPVLENWFNNTPSASWYHGTRTGLDQWTYSESPGGYYFHDTHCILNVNCYGTGDGLYMYSSGNVGYGAGHYTEYYYRPYAWDTRSTYIPRVEFGYQYNTSNNGANNFGIVDGIFSSAGAWTGYTVLGETSNTYTTVRVGDNITNPDIANSKLAVFAAVPTTTTHPGRGTYYTGSAIVVLDDAEDPGITVTHSSPVPTTWVKEYSDRASFAGHDNGLGIGAFNVYRDYATYNTFWQPSMSDSTVTCTGGNAHPCYTDRTGYYDYTAASLGDGAHPLVACAFDATGKYACSTWWVYVDRIGPQINTPSGDVWTTRDDDIPFHHPAGLTVSVSDAHSAIKRIMVKVDGNIVASSAPGETSLNWTLDPDTLTPDLHTIQVTAVDSLDNTTGTPLTWDIQTATSTSDPVDVDGDGTAATLESVTSATQFRSSDGTPTCAPDDDGITYCSFRDDAANTTLQDALEEPGLDDPVAEPRSDGASGLPARDSGWGLADDSTNHIFGNFGDPSHTDQRFSALGVKRVRKIISWDVIERATSGTANSSVVTRSCGGTKEANERPSDREHSRIELNQTDEWMASAAAAGLKVMISLGATRGVPCYLPSVSQYQSAFASIMNRYRGQVLSDPPIPGDPLRPGSSMNGHQMPNVLEYSAWNEPNDGGQPMGLQWLPRNKTTKAVTSYLRIERAAKFWRAASGICLTKVNSPCVVAAGEFIDNDAFGTRQAGSYFKHYKDGLARDEPAIWAWHAYNAGWGGPRQFDSTVADPNPATKRSIARLQQFLIATRGTKAKAPRLWLSEQGGRYDLWRRFSNDHSSQPAARKAAGQDMQFLVDLPKNPSLEGRSRIERFYAFSWSGYPEGGVPSQPRSKGNQPFDSGFTNANSQPSGYYYPGSFVPTTGGKTTPAYCVFYKRVTGLDPATSPYLLPTDCPAGSY